MGIAFVGGGAVGPIGTSAVTYAFSSLLAADGSTPTLQQNDLVVVTTTYRQASAAYDQTPTDPSSTAYTAAFANIAESGQTNAVNLKTTYKFMGASPDASVTIPAAPGSSLGSCTVHVFRGVDTTTPLDVTPTTAEATGASHPGAPAITPTTAGAWIYVCGGVASGAGVTNLTAPSNLDTTTNSYQATHSNQSDTAAGIYSGWTSGAFSPNAFGGYIPGAAGSWGAATVALRPLGAGGSTLGASAVGFAFSEGSSLTRIRDMASSVGLAASQSSFLVRARLMSAAGSQSWSEQSMLLRTRGISASTATSQWSESSTLVRLRAIGTSNVAATWLGLASMGSVTILLGSSVAAFAFSNAGALSRTRGMVSAAGFQFSQQSGFPFVAHGYLVMLGRTARYTVRFDRVPRYTVTF